MQVHIRKTDGGLVIPVPETLVSASELTEDSVVEIALKNGKIVVSDPDEPYYTLEELLEGITEENRHAEISTGRPVGNEVW